MSVAAALARGLSEMRLELPPAAEETIAPGRLRRPAEQVEPVYNLTAIRDPQQVVTHHLLDALSVLPQLIGVKTLPTWARAAAPGIPLAIARPDLQVTSIETVSKKASFQQQVKIELGLDNFDRCARGWRRCARRSLRRRDLAAFSDLADFIELTAHLLAPHGRFYAMKGVDPVTKSWRGCPTASSSSARWS